MIGFLRGTVDSVSADSVLIDVNGIGFEVNISTSTAAEMPGTGEEVRLYTYMAVREDDMSLFGFLHREELDYFKLLITSYA